MQRKISSVLRYRIVFALLLSTILVAIGWSAIAIRRPARNSPKLLRPRLARSKLPLWDNGSTIDVKSTGFVVDTPVCRIPDFDAYNPSIVQQIRDPRPQFTVCNHSLPVTFTDRLHVRINTTLAKSLGIHHCTYQQVCSVVSLCMVVGFFYTARRHVSVSLSHSCIV